MAKPTQQEIYDVLNKCAEHEDEGVSIYPGMSYEQGVAAALRWVADDASNPLED